MCFELGEKYLLITTEPSMRVVMHILRNHDGKIFGSVIRIN